MMMLLQRLLLLLLCCSCCFIGPPLVAAYSAGLNVHQDATDVGGTSSGDSSRAQSCGPVPIAVPMCQSIRYNTTSDRLAFKQSEVAQGIKHFDDLIRLPCAPFLRLFVCSMHLPFCNSEQRLLVLPCREFCTRIRDLCTPVMLVYGYSWPEKLACDSLPPETGAGGSSKNLCLRPKAEDFDAELAQLRLLHPQAPLLPPHSFLPGGPAAAAGTDADSRERPTRRPPANTGATATSARACSTAEVRLGSASETNASSGRLCAPRCHASLQYFAEDKQFATAWMLVWSVLCLLCTSAAVATFLLDCSRFCFPERPIVWVAVCYALYSTAHILRVIVGPELACSGGGSGGASDGDDSYRVSRHAGHWCAAQFLLLHFSWLAGLLWWLALTLCWYLCAVKKWAHEALAAKAVWLHLVAWGAPLLVSVLLLVLHRIEADELTHLCVVDGSRPANLLAFVIAPCAAALALGLGFLGCALCSSVSVRDSLKLSGNAGFRRLEKLMTKISLFSFLYVLPTVCVLAASVYEYWERPGWTDSLEQVLARRPRCVDAGGIRAGDADCLPERRPSSALYMLKIFMSLAAGLPSGLMVWVNGKSAAAWRVCLCRLVRPCCRRHGSKSAGTAGAGAGAGKFRQYQQQTYSSIGGGTASVTTATANNNNNNSGMSVASSFSTAAAAAGGRLQSLQHQHQHQHTGSVPVPARSVGLGLTSV